MTMMLKAYGSLTDLKITILSKTYFFDEDSINFWKNINIEEDKNEYKKSKKFKLLHWRIN